MEIMSIIACEPEATNGEVPVSPPNTFGVVVIKSAVIEPPWSVMDTAKYTIANTHVKCFFFVQSSSIIIGVNPATTQSKIAGYNQACDSEPESTSLISGMAMKRGNCRTIHTVIPISVYFVDFSILFFIFDLIN